MPRPSQLLAVTALCGALLSCSAVEPGGGLDPDAFDDVDLATTDVAAARAMAPQGAPFSQGLRTGYFALADAQEPQGDLTDFLHFTRKAVAAAKGLNVRPDMVELRAVPAERAGELAAARARLLAALDRGGRREAGPAAARAQVAYDCWLEETAAGNAPAAEKCRQAFEDAMRAVESALATGIGNQYLVFFAWDQVELTPVTRQMLEQVAADYKAGRIARVRLAGHADRSGSPAYNLRLSERRARVAAAELAALGVPAASITLEWFGETRPRVPTADGVRDAQNRRVEVTFE